MDDQAAELIAEQLRVLGQPMRVRLIARLQRGPATVSELTDSLAAVQQNVSQHLAVMHKAGLLDRRKVGTHVFYEISDAYATTILDATRQALARRSEQLARRTAAFSDDADLTTEGSA